MPSSYSAVIVIRLIAPLRTAAGTSFISWGIIYFRSRLLFLHRHNFEKFNDKRETDNQADFCCQILTLQEEHAQIISRTAIHVPVLEVTKVLSNPHDFPTENWKTICPTPRNFILASRRVVVFRVSTRLDTHAKFSFSSSPPSSSRPTTTAHVGSNSSQPCLWCDLSS